MKTVYIPAGATYNYETLVTDDVIVHGHLHVTNGLKAKHISGRGFITAGEVSADIVDVTELECGTVICRRLLAQRVSVNEAMISERAAVSRFFSANYVKAPSLTVAVSEIGEADADEIVHLTPKPRGMLLTLLLSMLRTQTFSTGPYWNSPTVKELVILIGAVDNNKSRKLCHEVFYKLDDLIYIDSGNGMHTGQIVCGIRSGGRTFYRPVGAAFPEVLQDTDKFPTELSCAEASVSAPQSIAANITAATAVVDMIYNILTVGETRVRQITFATGSVNMRATLQKTRRKAA